MLSFLEKYAHNYKYSQNGEEGIVLEIISRLQLGHGHAVEIGGNNGLYCSNTALLLREHGWSGLFVEGDYSLHLESKKNYANLSRVRHQCCFVDDKNVNAFVPDYCDLLSLDTDGSDYKIFKGLRARPKIVIVEIDSSIPPEEEGFNSDGGASYRTMLNDLALGRGYFLLAHTGNLVLLRDEYINLFAEVWGTHPLRNSQLYFNRGWLKAA